MEYSSEFPQSARVSRRRKRNHLPLEPVAGKAEPKTALIEKFAHNFGPHLARQLRAARGWLNWTREDLALRSDVSVSTIRRMERENFQEFRASLPSILRVVQTLEQFGAILKDPNPQARSLGGVEFREVGIVDTVQRLWQLREAHTPLADR